MRGTDYEFPSEWPSMTPEEKSEWFEQERCRRQAMRQNTPFRKNVEREVERLSFLDRVRKFTKLGK
ncbi:hypothetical protein HRTV-25_gp48 [Halorubrum tailed virus 25]|uniref:Uncharacterized protein n=1 Tax=Halorubrum tailed virus 25 TaxID=2878006 RepID=A0AAE9BY86_9CAUD|nr:hypothetical protein M1M37_gp048 [Halorubrum tailed virus 25]UBF22629.1 hypothetical protein HRTV-25_gp48 [Halorubrum tailed virus 25]